MCRNSVLDQLEKFIYNRRMTKKDRIEAAKLYLQNVSEESGNDSQKAKQFLDALGEEK